MGRISLIAVDIYEDSSGKSNCRKSSEEVGKLLQLVEALPAESEVYGNGGGHRFIKSCFSTI
ncbi:hypothetical protein ACLIBH_04140 [Virgibacillus sp. W0430]|uniref:hypothetical protein n=1 Tax=Virgibacillus sp. W0430 TaxID=3391580 RepID=UPI003F46171C